MLAIVTWFAVVEEVAKELEMEADASDPKLALVVAVVVAVVVVVVVAVVVAVVVVEEEVESVTAAEGEPLVGKKFLMEVWRFEVVR
jgi:flagellar basal body-associated protein FliL